MASITPEYGYTWVKGPWFLTSVFYLDGSPMYTKFSTTQTVSNHEWEFALKARIKLGAGYTGSTWQAGIRTLADSPSARPGGIEFNWIAQTVELNAGRRL